ncbi:MAG: type 1 glutamine amidotransferase domain-containing protein [Cyanobacteriota bacterium]
MQSKRVLIVLTSHDTLGDTGKETGFYLPEVTHPYEAFEKASFEIDFVSPQGGKAPMIGVDLQDPLNKAFLDAPAKIAQVENTLTPTQVDPTRYDAIFYAGGHGTMWDFPDNEQLVQIAATIYERGGVVGAVCHRPAGLVNIKLSDGTYLVAGKTVASFTNEEEAAVGLSEVVPFLLESRLIERGANHTKAGNFQAHVVVSDRLVTGQNPASAKGVGERMVELIQEMPTNTAALVV